MKGFPIVGTAVFAFCGLMCTAFPPIAVGQAFRPVKLAVTVDDLPAHGPLPPGSTRTAVARAVLKALRDNGISQAYGFANGYMEKYEGGVNQVLQLWLDAGYPLGNHTYDHLQLDKVSADAYIANIAGMDNLLQTVASAEPIAERRVFRYPYLEEGETLKKRDAIRAFLFSYGYRIAEVTTSYNDWAWDNAYVRCVKQNDQQSIAWLKTNVVSDADWHLNSSAEMSWRLLHRNIPQILLIHVGAFDAVMLSTILNNFHAHHVTFITLDEALADPVYKLNPNYAYTGEYTFLKQIADSRHVSATKWPGEIYPLRKLDNVCAQNTRQ
jgi:peptidoglycan/xylan/chitin deacetylase (PgdA/CDA1 family)